MIWRFWVTALVVFLGVWGAIESLRNAATRYDAPTCLHANGITIWLNRHLEVDGVTPGYDVHTVQDLTAPYQLHPSAADTDLIIEQHTRDGIALVVLRRGPDDHGHIILRDISPGTWLDFSIGPTMIYARWYDLQGQSHVSIFTHEGDLLDSRPMYVLSRLWSPDGRQLLIRSGSYGKPGHLWLLRDRRLQQLVEATRYGSLIVAWSRDCQRFFSYQPLDNSSEKGILHIFDSAGDLTAQYETPIFAPEDFDGWSPSGRYVMLATPDYHLYPAEQGPSLDSGLPPLEFRLQWAHHTDRLVGWQGRHVVVMDLSGEQVYRWAGSLTHPKYLPASDVLGAEWSPDDRYLRLTYRGQPWNPFPGEPSQRIIPRLTPKTVFVFEVAERVRVRARLETDFYQVYWSDSANVLTYMRNATTKFSGVAMDIWQYDVSTGQHRRVLHDVRRVAYYAGSLFVIHRAEGSPVGRFTVEQLSLATGRVHHMMTLSAGGRNALFLSSSFTGGFLLLHRVSDNSYFWFGGDGRLVYQVDLPGIGYGDEINPLIGTLHYDPAHFQQAMVDATIYMVRAATGEIVKLPFEKCCANLAVAPDDSGWLLLTEELGRFVYMDHRGQEMVILAEGERVERIIWSPDSRYVAYLLTAPGGGEPVVWVYEPGTGQRMNLGRVWQFAGTTPQWATCGGLLSNTARDILD